MVAGDLRLLALIVLALAAVLGVVALLLKARGVDVRRVLTPAEWRVAFKIAATALMLYTLLLRVIYAELPVERFIYGRF